MGKCKENYGNLQEAQKIILNYIYKNTPSKQELNDFLQKNRKFRECSSFLNLENMLNSMTSFHQYLEEKENEYNITGKGFERLTHLKKKHKETTSQ